MRPERAMRVKWVVVVLLAVAITVFALNNTAPTSIRFLFWTWDGVPLATVVLLSIAIGIVAVGVPLWFTAWRLRTRVRQLEARPAAPTEPPRSEPRDTSPPR